MDLDKIEKDGREVFRVPNRQKKIEMLVFLLGIVFGLVLCLGLFWGLKMFIETYQPMDNIEKFDVADGAHVVQIVNAQRTWTKDKTKQMVLVDLRVEGQRNQCNYQFRIVEGESFGMVMTNFFKMFGIQLGNFSFMTWLNMRAMGNFEHKRRTYNGREIESCELTSFAPIAQQPPMYGA